jgi:hypothetical protein
MWKLKHTCYKRPEKFITEALKPVVKFRMYEVPDSAAIRDFYSLLRTIKLEAKVIRHLKMLIKGQTLPNIIKKMPMADWKQWAIKRPTSIKEEVEVAFRKFVEQKRRDTLYVAGAEPTVLKSQK